jgi:serine/threonine protein kinase/Tfp pilus assembly protein PilF
MHSESNATSLLVFVDQLCNDFEDSWKKGEHPRIEVYLTRVPDSARTLALRELIALDVACRAKDSDTPRAEDYEARFPNFTDVISEVFSKPHAPGSATLTQVYSDEDAQSVAMASRGTSTVAGSEAPMNATPAHTGRVIPSAGVYRVVEKIGQGGLGLVYLGEDARIGRKVAIKEMRRETRASTHLVRRFKEEAQITGMLEHPNIVPIYDLGQLSDGSPYYAMRLLGKKTLRDTLRAFHDLPANTAQKTLKQSELLRAFVNICQALAFAHSRGILHRDLKPANIVLGEFGEVFVLDWGLAKILHFDRGAERDDSPASQAFPDHPHATSSEGSVLGTPAYMSPEQAHGQNDQLGPRSDIFSLGAILYEILVGQPPYKGKSTLEVVSKAQKGAYESPRSLDRKIAPALEAICLKAMALAPTDRYADATELAEEVMRWQAGEPVLTYPEPWHQRAGRWAKRHRTTCWTTFGIAMTMGLAFGVWLWQEDVRLKSLRTESLPLLLEGQKLLTEGNIDAARLELSKVNARIAGEAALRDVEAKVHDLLSEAESRIQLREAARADQTLLANFRKKREDALFMGTLLSNQDLAASLKQAQRAAEEGLALFGVPLEQFRDPQLSERHFTARQKKEIEAECRDLMLIRVSALAQPLPEDQAEARQANVRAALALLDQPGWTEANALANQLIRGKCHLLLGENEKAQGIFRSAKTAAPLDARDAFFSGLESFFANQYPEAMARFDLSLQKKPDQFWSQYFLAVCHLQDTANAKTSAPLAIAHLTACLDRRPDFIWNYLLRGVAYGFAGNDNAAEADFQQATRLDPNEYALYVNRGGVRLNGDKLELAEQDLRRAVELAPDRHQAYLNLAELELKKRNLTEAIRLIDQTISRAPLYAPSYAKRAKIRVERDELKEALADLNHAARLEVPGSLTLARLHGERGRLLYRLDDFNLAKGAYDAALTRPELKEILALRALTLIKLDQNDLARKDLDAFIEQSQPIDLQRMFLGQAHGERGLLRGGAQEHLPAMEDFVQALALYPDPRGLKEYDRGRWAFIRVRRGWSLLQRSPQLAAEDFDKAIAINPMSADAHNGRGYARVLLGKVDEGIKDAETAVALAENEPLDSRPGLYTNAACIFAQAIPRIRYGPPRKDTEVLLQKTTQRSLQLLRQGITMLPLSQRADFAREICADPALDPLRDHAEFKKLIPGS